MPARRKIQTHFKLPQVPPGLTKAQKALEAARKTRRETQERREKLAAIARRGVGIPDEAQEQIDTIDTEIAALDAAVDAAHAKHTELVQAYAREANAVLSGPIHEYQRAVAAVVSDLDELLQEGVRVRSEAAAIGVKLSANSLDVTPHLLRLLGVPKKLTSDWR